MRHRRVKITEDEHRDGFYHLIARAINKEFLFNSDDEKRRLLSILTKSASFCCVELYTYCIMSNHVHLLVKVPPRREISDKELMDKMMKFYSPKRLAHTLHDWDVWIDSKDFSRVERAKSALRKRMFNVSQFMKTFKELYAEDYNYRYGRTGSIWGGSRFKSVLLEGDYTTLLSVASYIHLNPVRAGMVPQPTEYNWSGFGAATASSGAARDALVTMLADVQPRRKKPDWAEAKHTLVEAMGEEGLEPILDEKTFSRKLSEAEYDEDGQMPVSLFQMLRHKLRIFAEGLMIGSHEFIETRYRDARPGSYEAERKNRNIHKAPCGDICYACRRASREA